MCRDWGFNSIPDLTMLVLNFIEFSHCLYRHMCRRCYYLGDEISTDGRWYPFSGMNSTLHIHLLFLTTSTFPYLTQNKYYFENDFLCLSYQTWFNAGANNQMIPSMSDTVRRNKALGEGHQKKSRVESHCVFSNST